MSKYIKFLYGESSIRWIQFDFYPLQVFSLWDSENKIIFGGIKGKSKSFIRAILSILLNFLSIKVLWSSNSCKLLNRKLVLVFRFFDWTQSIIKFRKVEQKRTKFSNDEMHLFSYLIKYEQFIQHFTAKREEWINKVITSDLKQILVLDSQLLYCERELSLNS